MALSFEEFIQRHTNLTDADIARIMASALRRKLRRNEVLLSEGQICRYKVFNLHGLLRIYGVAADGNESILQFAPEEHWAIDAESYNEEKPSRYYIDAVEPTEILYWHKSDFSNIVKEFPELRQYAERLISQNVHLTRNRLAQALGASPEEKYLDFETNHPHLIARLPLRMIAAYLGVSLKTLTRIRHAQLIR